MVGTVAAGAGNRFPVALGRILPVAGRVVGAGGRHQDSRLAEAAAIGHNLSVIAPARGTGECERTSPLRWPGCRARGTCRRRAAAFCALLEVVQQRSTAAAGYCGNATRRAASRAACTAGKSRAIRMPMMAIDDQQLDERERTVNSVHDGAPQARTRTPGIQCPQLERGIALTMLRILSRPRRGCQRSFGRNLTIFPLGRSALENRAAAADDTSTISHRQLLMRPAMKRPIVLALLSPALLSLSVVCSRAGQASRRRQSRYEPRRCDARGVLRGRNRQAAQGCLAEIKTLDDWNAKKGEYRRQLLEMLGLDPLPERTDLKAEVTGTRRAGRIRRREAALPVAAGAVRHGQPVPAEEGRPAAAGDSVCLRARGGEEGRRELRQQGALPASRGLVRPQRLRLPDDRHAAARRDRGDPPRHAPLRHVVVAQSGLHAGRRRGVELRAGPRLPGDAARSG